MDVHKAAVASFLFRFFMSVSAELEAELPGSAPLFGPSDKLGIPANLPFDGLSKGAQHFPVAAPEAIVGHAHMHMAARSQVGTHGHAYLYCNMTSHVCPYIYTITELWPKAHDLPSKDLLVG